MLSDTPISVNSPSVIGEVLDGEVIIVNLDSGAYYSKPFLQKYTDMAALLLLNPIHEVDEQGWPQPAPYAWGARPLVRTR